MEGQMVQPKRILGICGSAKKAHSSSEFLLSEALSEAEEGGAETKLVRLADYKILPCRGCGLCMDNRHCPILKDSTDELRLLFDECLQANGFIFSTPVYAFTLPSLWANWVQRCGPVTDQDLAYRYYGYDTAREVKGKAFKGKTTGLIAVAASLGHEAVWSALTPLFTCYQMNIVASVSMSLFEYDGQPHIRAARWSKDIHQADFAIGMARAVGSRVVESIDLVQRIRSGGIKPGLQPDQMAARPPA
ncbi:MAG TPA: flavodoxin family protein [Anaerolineaceae bacterium]|nr:flavodoxin family protein [Anaerolineaceae bacterium]